MTKIWHSIQRDVDIVIDLHLIQSHLSKFKVNARTVLRLSSQFSTPAFVRGIRAMSHNIHCCFVVASEIIASQRHVEWASHKREAGVRSTPTPLAPFAGSFEDGTAGLVGG